MKSHTEYECEVCGKRYSDTDVAFACERQDSGDPPVKTGQTYAIWEGSTVYRGRVVGSKLISDSSCGYKEGTPTPHRWEVEFDRPMTSANHFASEQYGRERFVRFDSRNFRLEEEAKP